MSNLKTCCCLIGSGLLGALGCGEARVIEDTHPPAPVQFVAVQPQLFGDGGTLTDAWADFDGDGDPDRFVGFNGRRSRLYRNDRDNGFVDIAEAVGLVVERAVRTSAWGDYDADGDPDLFLGFAGDAPVTALFRNDNGTGFVSVAAQVGLELVEGATRQASWVDYDSDGDLDLFLALRDGVNRLFRNDGPAGFVDVTVSSGIGDERRTVGAVWLDADQDGDLDVVTANMNGDANGLWINDGGSFTDMAPGTTVAGGGRALGDDAQGSVRVCAVDANTDGLFDLFFANYGPNALLLATDAGVWSDGSANPGLSVAARYDTCVWGDMDNDGTVDLYVNGTVSAGQHYRDHLYRREASEVFVDATPPELLELNASHGATWVDFDLDGDLDLALAGAADDAMHHLMENQLDPERAQHSLQIRVLDDEGRATRPGAEVRVYVAGTDQLLGVRLVDTGSGYDAQSDLPVHFGLPGESVVDVAVTLAVSGERRTGRLENVSLADFRNGILTVRIDSTGRIIR
jgi:hypothetical protein